MPMMVDWYDKTQNIILLRFIENWTLEEYSAANVTLQQLCQQAVGRFDMIADLSEAAYSPPVGTLWDWKQYADLRDSIFPDWGLTVFITPSRVYNAFFEEGIQTSDVVRKHSRLAKNVIEAVQIIRADRANTKQVG
jgi:hypothetical protein